MVNSVMFYNCSRRVRPRYLLCNFRMRSVNQQASSKEVYFIDVGFVNCVSYQLGSLCFVYGRWSKWDQYIFSKSDISKHKNPSRAEDLTKLPELDTKVHLQVSPYPSCWWTTVSIARALKGGRIPMSWKEMCTKVGRKSIYWTRPVTLADLKATLKQNARAQKDLNHKIKVKCI